VYTQHTQMDRTTNLLISSSVHYIHLGGDKYVISISTRSSMQQMYHAPFYQLLHSYLPKHCSSCHQKCSSEILQDG